MSKCPFSLGSPETYQGPCLIRVGWVRSCLPYSSGLLYRSTQSPHEDLRDFLTRLFYIFVCAVMVYSGVTLHEHTWLGRTQSQTRNIGFYLIVGGQCMKDLHLL